MTYPVMHLMLHTNLPHGQRDTYENFAFLKLVDGNQTKSFAVLMPNGRNNETISGNKCRNMEDANE